VCAPSQPTSGLVERRKLPQRRKGGALRSGRKLILQNFELEKNEWDDKDFGNF